MQPKPSIVHLPVYQPGKPIEDVKRELGLDKVIKLASNENPFGCSPKAKEAIIRELDQLSLYPDGAAISLTEEVAKRNGVRPDQIIFGCGSDEVIEMIAKAFFLPGDETVMATHTFSQYRHNAEVEGAVIVEAEMKDGTHDLDAMLAKVTDKTKIVWICNPNNPTGTMLPHQTVADFLNKISAEILVVLDEAYIEYVTAPDFPNGLELLKQHKNLILLRTFSKIYGLAALRIGYGIGHPDIIKLVAQVRPPFNTTRTAQAAALAAIQDVEFVARCREANAEGIQYLTGEFDRMGLRHFPAHGNFIMVEVGRPSKDVFDALLRKGYIIRAGHALGFPTSIRVTVGSREQNEGFIAALSEVLAQSAVEA
ncbi:histidinol-phosphate transaminase [Gorillibacterium timonense]|uniref:histidinol-phosphate transaminase n=1 Tax=Gorillibacterium timonense TaxID=1689269 RepID=UPI00071E4317|nr:histidinol-phosphate transaminase [Gorillibacterium timonense]